MRILLVEDEIQLAKSLKKILEHHKYTVDLVHNGLDVSSFLKVYSYDIILLDIMLPGLDGVSILKEIRDMDLDVKIIMLSAKDMICDKVDALDYGADDYVTKPFSSIELLARIRTSLRRTTSIQCINSFHDIFLDTNTYTLKSNNKEFVLGKKEYQIMKLLIEAKNTIIPHDTLFNKIWNSESNVSDGVLWTYISYLRKKLKLLETNVTIKAFRGIGYSLEVIV